MRGLRGGSSCLLDQVAAQSPTKSVDWTLTAFAPVFSALGSEMIGVNRKISLQSERCAVGVIYTFTLCIFESTKNPLINNRIYIWLKICLMFCVSNFKFMEKK